MNKIELFIKDLKISIDSTKKITFTNASYQLSGNFIIIIEEDIKYKVFDLKDVIQFNITKL